MAALVRMGTFVGLAGIIHAVVIISAWITAARIVRALLACARGLGLMLSGLLTRFLRSVAAGSAMLPG